VEEVADTYWYLEAVPELKMADIAERCERFVMGERGAAMTPLAPHLTAFFQQRLPDECRASIHTSDSYAYAFKLLLEYAPATSSGSRLHTCSWSNSMRQSSPWGPHGPTEHDGRCRCPASR
jgi:hypothetical protein